MIKTVSHGERKHAKYSASGAERWVNCSGSVPLSEGMPDKSSPWALEGTSAHEMLEKFLLNMRDGLPVKVDMKAREMVTYGRGAATFIWNVYQKLKEAELLVESKVHLNFIHHDMFGTFDSAIVDHFGTLHVFDYKYGKGHAVLPIGNLQMIFYGLGLAHQYSYNFKNVRLWIIQPRVRGFNGPTFWDTGIAGIQKYAAVFKKAVDRIENGDIEYREGQWCYFCKAKTKCPLKRKQKVEKASSFFTAIK